MVFADRIDAGRQLAARLQHLRGARIVVLGLPRGGVPVALEVAQALGAPLDVIVVHRLASPLQRMGAVGEGGARVFNWEIANMAQVPEEWLERAAASEQTALESRAARYRAHRPRQPLSGRVAVLVDDGIITGVTARAACAVARMHDAARVVLAVPVAPPGWEEAIGGNADELICLDTPDKFFAIAQSYTDFLEVSDDEVIACLERGSPPA